MPDPKRVLWYLRKVPLLADLGPDAIARMAERVELREARRRDVVYLPGDPGRSLFFVHGGRIKVSKVTRDGKSLTLAYHGPAELFGDSCLLDGGPRTEMAEAVENALLSEIDRVHFEAGVLTRPEERIPADGKEPAAAVASGLEGVPRPVRSQVRLLNDVLGV